MDKTNLAELAALVDWEGVAADVLRRRAEQQGAPLRKETDVKCLFQVFVVDPKTDEILVDGQFEIAKSDETAKFRVLSGLDRDPDDLYVWATSLFRIPDPEKE